MSDRYPHRQAVYSNDYEEKYQQKQAEFNLAVGVLAGLAIGLLWEAIRR